MITEPVSLLLADKSDIAGMIGGLMLWRTGPITPVISALTGAVIRVRTETDIYESPFPSEVIRYALVSDTTMYRRSGELLAEDTPVIRISLDLITSRVPEWALIRIIRGEPIGTVLGSELGRKDREVSLPECGDIAVCSSAVLTYGGLPIGMATENVFRSFCDRIAQQ